MAAKRCKSSSASGNAADLLPAHCMQMLQWILGPCLLSAGWRANGQAPAKLLASAAGQQPAGHRKGQQFQLQHLQHTSGGQRWQKLPTAAVVCRACKPYDLLYNVSQCYTSMLSTTHPPQAHNTCMHTCARTHIQYVVSYSSGLELDLLLQAQRLSNVGLGCLRLAVYSCQILECIGIQACLRVEMLLQVSAQLWQLHRPPAVQFLELLLTRPA